MDLCGGDTVIAARLLWYRLTTLLAPAKADRHAHERGQVLPIAALFMSIFILLAVFLIDIAGVQNVAGRAITGALRLGGLAALQERGTSDDYGRWYVCPPAGQGSFAAGLSCDGLDGDAIAREYVAQNLLGDPSLGNGGYNDIFGSRAAGIAILYSGTNGGANDGLDVEILDPAAQDGQASDAFINGVAESVVVANAGSFPECLTSTLLPGESFCTATVILRIRLPSRHVISSIGTTETTVLVKVGTDAN